MQTDRTVSLAPPNFIWPAPFTPGSAALLSFPIPAANMPVSLPRSPSGGLVWPLPIFPSLWKCLSSFSLAAYLHLYHCVFPLSSPSLPLSRRSSAISPLRFLYIPSPMSLSLCLLRHACLSSFCRPPSQLTLDIQSFSSPRVPLPSPPWPRVTQESQRHPSEEESRPGKYLCLPTRAPDWNMVLGPCCSSSRGAGQDAARL